MEGRKETKLSHDDDDDESDGAAFKFQQIMFSCFSSSLELFGLFFSFLQSHRVKGKHAGVNC